MAKWVPSDLVDGEFYLPSDIFHGNGTKPDTNHPSLGVFGSKIDDQSSELAWKLAAISLLDNTHSSVNVNMHHSSPHLERFRAELRQCSTVRGPEGSFGYGRNRSSVDYSARFGHERGRGGGCCGSGHGSSLLRPAFPPQVGSYDNSRLIQRQQQQQQQQQQQNPTVHGRPILPPRVNCPVRGANGTGVFIPRINNNIKPTKNKGMMNRFVEQQQQQKRTEQEQHMRMAADFGKKQMLYHLPSEKKMMGLPQDWTYSP